MSPDIDLGTFRFDDAEAAKAVCGALEMGYRPIDMAEMYGKERGVGEGIRRAGVSRRERFITTRVWHRHLRLDDTLATIRASLNRPGLDRIDLALIHRASPEGDVPVAETLGALTEARRQGLIQHSGVSNFTQALLEEALKTPEGADIATNQVEVHPWLANRELVGLCQERGLPVTAHMPPAQARVRDHPVLKAVARKYNARPAPAALAWLLARGLIVIPASRGDEHHKINFHARDLQLDPEDYARIDDLGKGLRLINPAFAPNWKSPTA